MELSLESLNSFRPKTGTLEQWNSAYVRVEDYLRPEILEAVERVRTRLTLRELPYEELRQGSVLDLPFADDMFDLVTAVETHFWWPDLPADMREVLRVLKPSGTFIIIAEIFKGADTRIAKLAEKYLPLSGMTLLSTDEHRELFANARYSDVRIATEPGKGWICATGRKPSTP